MIQRLDRSQVALYNGVRYFLTKSRSSVRLQGCKIYPCTAFVDDRLPAIPHCWRADAPLIEINSIYPFARRVFAMYRLIELVVACWTKGMRLRPPFSTRQD